MVFSCSKKQEGTKEPSTTTVVDTTKISKVGADEDAHGCKTSAGYTWSELRQECVRVFETGTRLDPVDVSGGEAVISAFVIFKGNRAEVFMQAEKSPFILERKSEGEPYVKNDWQLIPWKGYVLKKGDKILFTGK